MRRRDFIAFTGVAGAAAVFPRLALAQQAKLPRVAICSGGVPTSEMRIGGDVNWSAVLETLQNRGFVEGKTVLFERCLATGAGAPDAARAVIESKPDFIFWGGAGTAALAAQKLDKTIPTLVMGGDPVANGLVDSLSHPRGNITAVSDNSGPVFFGKVLEFLCEAVPTAKVIAYITAGVNGQIPATSLNFVPDKAAIDRLKISFLPIVVEQPGSEIAFAAAVQQAVAMRADAIQFGYNTSVQFWSPAEAAACIAAKMPAISPFDQFAPAGGLISYATDIEALSRQVGEYLALMLKGTKPADLPVFLASTYNLVINLKTAKAIGATIPERIVIQATSVVV